MGAGQKTFARETGVTKLEGLSIVGRLSKNLARKSPGTHLLDPTRGFQKRDVPHISIPPIPYPKKTVQAPKNLLHVTSPASPK